MAPKPLCVRVPQDIDDWVRAKPNYSAWLREAIVTAVKQAMADASASE